MKFESRPVAQILAAAQEIIERVPYCWVVTADQRGGANARVMQPIFSQLGAGGWVVRFLTSGSSRKAKEIASSGRVALGYQYDAEKAHVTLVGSAKILDDRQFLQEQWRAEWNIFFEKGSADLDSVFLEVTVERIEVWSLLRKVAAPPDGARAATLQRTLAGDWQSLGG